MGQANGACPLPCAHRWPCMPPPPPSVLTLPQVQEAVDRLLAFGPVSSAVEAAKPTLTAVRWARLLMLLPQAHLGGAAACCCPGPPPAGVRACPGAAAHLAPCSPPPLLRRRAGATWGCTTRWWPRSATSRWGGRLSPALGGPAVWARRVATRLADPPANGSRPLLPPPPARCTRWLATWRSAPRPPGCTTRRWARCPRPWSTRVGGPARALHCALPAAFARAGPPCTRHANSPRHASLCPLPPPAATPYCNQLLQHLQPIEAAH